jgi:hypothetical protein
MWRNFDTDPPTRDGEYLGYLGAVMQGTMRQSVFVVRSGQLKTVGGHFYYDAPKITHWMELPSEPIGAQK